jgi:hypothetical protein
VRFRFYLGTHMPAWLWNPLFRDVPLFVSRRRLARRKGEHPRSTTDWALDSGGFTELSMHGRWTLDAKQYVAQVRQYRDELGRLEWAAPQDWMCEPPILAKTGFTVAEHQLRTTENLLELRELAPEIDFVPVVQGWSERDYHAHVEQYDKAGVDLRLEPRVGVGTICRRQGTHEAERIMRGLSAQGLRCHAFGAKVTGLRRYADAIASADSLAWSFRARKIGRLPGCVHAHHCANCPRWALLWRAELLAKIHGIPWGTWLTMSAEERLRVTGSECSLCGAPTMRAVHGARGGMVSICSACLEQDLKEKGELYMETKNAETEAMQAREEAQQALVQLQALEVSSANMEAVGVVLLEVKSRSKALESRLREITEPMRKAEKSVRDLFRPALDALFQAEALLKQRIAGAQRVQEQINRSAMLAAQASLEQGDSRGAALAAQVIAPTAPPQGVTTRAVWKFRVTNPDAVPRTLCSPDDAKIRAAVGAGTRSIPGVEIYEDTQVIARAR